MRALEDRIQLAAIFQDFPRADEAPGHDEGVAGAELQPLAVLARHGDEAGHQMTKLMLGVAHAPTAASRCPNAAKELLCWIRVVIPHRQPRIAFEEGRRIRRRMLRLYRGTKRNDLCGHLA